MSKPTICNIFFFQAENGIRDVAVTGVQTCALPICEEMFTKTSKKMNKGNENRKKRVEGREGGDIKRQKIGRASCRERV